MEDRLFGRAPVALEEKDDEPVNGSIDIEKWIEENTAGSLAKTSVCYESEKSDEGCLKKYIGHVIAPRIGFSCKIHCNVLLQGHNFRSALRPNIHSNRSWLPTKRRFPVRP